MPSANETQAPYRRKNISQRSLIVEKRNNAHKDREISILRVIAPGKVWIEGNGSGETMKFYDWSQLV